MDFRGKPLPEAVVETSLPGLTRKSGKVRDIYDVGDGLLIVASDRISAYDSILATGIPLKGRVLTGLSLFWFDYLADVTPNHFITSDLDEIGNGTLEAGEIFAGRSMLVRKARVIPIECVVRGYIAGSGWRSYKASGEVCGIEIPGALRQSDKLGEPIFTPSTKAEEGHDENISFEETVNTVGAEVAREIRDKSLAIYKKAADYAAERGVIIADTKFEFGVCDAGIILIDEVLTPDSSRFWPADDYEPGRSQKSFDKQYVRDYLDESGWDHRPPAPPLPDEVVIGTLDKYVEAYERLSGETFTF
jgi:phosphoribosylaminoimidazole-succinocarboxamide synthase